MFRRLGIAWLPLAALGFVLSSEPQQNRILVTAKNELPLARPSETIVLQAREISRSLAVDDLRRVRVTDEASGRELVSQWVDLNGDSAPKELVFQADFDPGQSRTFSLSTGSPRIPKREDFKVYGRFSLECT
jgi:hypothetical protein